MCYYWIVFILLVAVQYGNVCADNQTQTKGDYGTDSTDSISFLEVRDTGNELKSCTDSLQYVATALKDLRSELSTLKSKMEKISNYGLTSGCLVESEIFEGKSFPVGVNYRRVCHPNYLNEEVLEAKYPTSCREIQKNGNNVSGIYKIQPTKSNKPFMVLCDMETKGGGWTHIQKRYDGSVDFNVGWRHYKFGFGDLGSEFWLGLENIYKITDSEANELLIEIVDRKNDSAYAHYEAFAIGPEPGGYHLNTLRGFSGDAGDSLTSHLGMKFSTKDLDRDTSTSNCALTRGAWWYRSCYSSNLNSIFINAELPEQYVLGGLEWETFGPYNYCHARSRMMVRPKT